MQNIPPYEHFLNLSQEIQKKRKKLSLNDQSKSLVVMYLQALIFLEAMSSQGKSTPELPKIISFYTIKSNQFTYFFKVFIDFSKVFKKS